MKATVAVLGLAAAALALPAAAQMSMSAAYVGATVGQSKFKDCEGCSDDKDTAWRILGGYQLNPNFAAEIGYHDLGEAKGGGESVKATAWELSALGIFPVMNQLGIFGRLGAHHSELKNGGKDTGNGWTWGVGVQYDITRQLGLRGEFQRYLKIAGESDVKIDALTLGGIWRFR